MCLINEKELRFFKSFVSIPVVNTTLHLGTNIYFNVKKWNPYLETTLSATEHLAAYMASTPTIVGLVNKMEKPVVFIDSLAADGLQMLETKYPSIRMTPEDLAGEAHKQMIVLKGVGAKKLEALMHSICRQRKQQMECILNLLEASIGPKISIYVEVIERSVDDYLPPIESETIDESDQIKQRVFARLAYIPQRVQNRIVHRYNQFVLRITWTESESESGSENQIN